MERGEGENTGGAGAGMRANANKDCRGWIYGSFPPACAANAGQRFYFR